MKMTFQYRKSTGQVMSYSKGLNEMNSKFGQLELSVSKVEMDKMGSGDWSGFIKKGKLKFEKSPNLLSKEDTIMQDEIIDKMDKGEATQKDIAKLIMLRM